MATTTLKFFLLRRAQVQLQIVPSIYLHKISLQGLVIRVDALLKNPTGASFTIKYPFIEIMHKGTLIGSSQAVNKNIEIPAFGQVLIRDMMVEIPVLNFFSSLTIPHFLSEKISVISERNNIISSNLLIILKQYYLLKVL